MSDLGASKARRRVVVFTPKDRENGNLAMTHPLFVVQAATSIGDRCNRAGLGRMEGDVVVEWIKMMEEWVINHPFLPSITVRGCMRPVGSVGGP